MEKVINSRTIFSTKKATQNKIKNEEQNNRLIEAAEKDTLTLYGQYNSSEKGLNSQDILEIREKYGDNTVSYGKKESLIQRIRKAFVNPFTVILIGLAGVSLVTDVILAAPNEKEPMTVIIIVTMVIISGLLRFIQEMRSDKAAEELQKMIKTTTCVERSDTGRKEIPLSEIVVGDIIHLSAGDMIPADMRIISAKDLFISQSSMTGESEPVEKLPIAIQSTNRNSPLEYPNLAFMGTNVVSGTAKGIVIVTGNETIFGTIAKSLNKESTKTGFEKGVNSVSWLLIRFMFVMVPVVFFLNGFTKGNWMEAFLFSISIAVGLTPEMLPMIVTTCLAKGAVAMSKEKTIIKNLNSIQNLGSMDILCTDKTGTLTQDKVVLEYHLNVNGEEDARVLRHAFLNSYYQTGLKNLMDHAIISRTEEEQRKEVCLLNLSKNYQKIDEIPFDFERRRMSVVVEDSNRKTQMITKGAIEEMLAVCSYVEYHGEVLPLTEERKNRIRNKAEALNEEGMRVLAIAQKTNPSPVHAFGVKDESEMVFIGYLAFLDPPKESTAAAICALNEHGVAVKILTGDNDKVTKSICSQVGIQADHILLGSDIDKMSDEEAAKESEQVNVFAKLSPMQKERVISILRGKGHTVGYMGDGINDAAAMKASDVGISVDTAVDIAKESADVILLEKDLMVLEKGLLEGRRTYGNMIKYIKMTASSNFGNMFSVLAACVFLPFMPMLSVHLILLNLIYDLSCTAIPWDNVDREYLQVPRKWDASSIGRFMVWLGPVSSVFDIATYLLMYFVICPAVCGGLYHELTEPAMKTLYIALFQTGWFVESMWTQTLVIHMIRTPKLPFLQSHASLPVTLLTFCGIALLTVIPYTSLGSGIGLAALPASFFGWLAVIILLYMGMTTLVKNIYVRRYKELL